MCGKKNDTKWMYCSDKCVQRAKKRATEENRLLHLRAENAHLEKHVFALELEAEGFRPIGDWNITDKVDALQD